MLDKDITQKINERGCPITPAQVYKFREDNGLHSDGVVPRHCELCGKEFFSRWKTAKYCSEECRSEVYRIQRAERQRKKLENGIPKICPVCGAEFRITRIREQTRVYCSGKCYLIANQEQCRKRQHERYGKREAKARKPETGKLEGMHKRPRNFEKLSPLIQTTIIARENGMTYGKYQAQKYAAEHVKVGRAPEGYRKAGGRE